MNLKIDSENVYSININAVHNWRNVKHPSREYLVHLRVNANGKSSYFRVKDIPKIATRYWNGQINHWVKDSHPSGFEINQLLRKQIDNLYDFILKQKLRGRSISFDDIKEHHLGASKYELSFNDYSKKYIKEAKHLEYRTIQVYKSFQNHIDQFEPRLAWDDLTPALVGQFHRYLQNTKNLKGAARKKYFDKFKVIYREGCKQLQIQFNPLLFDSVNIKVEKPRRTSLSESAMEQWQGAAVQEDLSLYRDQFTFQLFTGLYYSDLAGLVKSECICSVGEDRKYIEGHRGKTQERFIIPLLPQAMAIINQYANFGCKGFFPKFISEQKYNRKLKQIAILLGWKVNISNKVARHSFTDMMISKGIPSTMVSKMLGHSKEETTKHYYDLQPNHLFKYLEEH